MKATLLDTGVIVALLDRSERHHTQCDAWLVDLADQINTGQILTLDGNFEIYRWRSRRKFELLIDLQHIS